MPDFCHENSILDLSDDWQNDSTSSDRALDTKKACPAISSSPVIQTKELGEHWGVIWHFSTYHFYWQLYSSSSVSTGNWFQEFPSAPHVYKICGFLSLFKHRYCICLKLKHILPYVLNHSRLLITSNTLMEIVVIVNCLWNNVKVGVGDGRRECLGMFKTNAIIIIHST